MGFSLITSFLSNSLRSTDKFIIILTHKFITLLSVGWGDKGTSGWGCYLHFFYSVLKNILKNLVCTKQIDY